MKKLLLLIALSGIIQFAQAQTKSCCSAPDQFASLSSDIAFVNKHENPVPFTFISEMGVAVTVMCNDGTTANGYALKSTNSSNKFLFVFHEWWGLNDYIKQTSEQLYKDLNAEVNIIAIDLYDGKVAAVRDSAKAYMNALSPERAKVIIDGFLTHVGDSAQIATIGWCMGGGYSMQASLQMQQQAIGCVMYYGMPESNTERLKTLQADVLMIWPNQDKWINKEVVDTFKANMVSLDKKLFVEEYNADHAFANPSNPKFDNEAATNANNKALIFLKSKFGIN